MRHPGGHLTLDRTSWFAEIESLYVQTSQATLPCQPACSDLFCESGNAEQVLFLPYELEYIREKLNLLSNPFESVPLDGVAYGFMTGFRDCPYFKGPDCLIHNLRPFDCRSFPILPRFDPGGSVDFKLSAYCPLSRSLDSQFIGLITSCWKDLAPYLPEPWKAYYNAHCCDSKTILLNR